MQQRNTVGSNGSNGEAVSQRLSKRNSARNSERNSNRISLTKTLTESLRNTNGNSNQNSNRKSDIGANKGNKARLPSRQHSGQPFRLLTLCASMQTVPRTRFRSGDSHRELM